MSTARQRKRWFRKIRCGAVPEGIAPPWTRDGTSPVGSDTIARLRATGFSWSQARRARHGMGDWVVVHDGRVTRRITGRQLAAAAFSHSRIV